MASLLSSSPPPPSSSVVLASTPHYKLLITAIVFILSFVALLLFNKTKSTRSSSKLLKLPPGPLGWPIVGNLFQVAFSSTPFIHYPHRLRELYGPIFTLRMGARILIIVTSPNLAHEALIAKGPLFANRPTENPTRNVFSSGQFTVNSAVHGPHWRSLCRNMVSGMLSIARLKEFRPARESTMDCFIQRFRFRESREGEL